MFRLRPSFRSTQCPRLYASVKTLATCRNFYNKESFHYDDMELLAREQKARAQRERLSNAHWVCREQQQVVSTRNLTSLTGLVYANQKREDAFIKSNVTNRHCGMTWQCKTPRTLVIFEQRRSFQISGEHLKEQAGRHLSQKERLKKHLQEHGTTGIVLYGALWVMSMSVCYLAVQSGVDVGVLLSKCGFSDDVVHSKLAAEATTFAIAYGAHTLIAPVRIGLTIAGTPIVVRLRNKNIGGKK